MLKRILTIVERFKNDNKRIEKRLAKCPYFIKWTQIQMQIKNAKSYDDWKAVQIFNIDLQWLVSINELAFNEKVKSIRQGNTYWLSQPKYKWTEGLDTRKIQNFIYLEFKEWELEVPIVFEKHNHKHREFVKDIAHEYENIIHETKFNELPLIESNLSFPKDFIFKSLSFFYTFCHHKDYDIPNDYIMEMRDKLKEFK